MQGTKAHCVLPLATPRRPDVGDVVAGIALAPYAISVPHSVHCSRAVRYLRTAHQSTVSVQNVQ
eukprot:1601239-Rhodomonas_salina.1